MTSQTCGSCSDSARGTPGAPSAFLSPAAPRDPGWEGGWGGEGSLRGNSSARRADPRSPPPAGRPLEHFWTIPCLKSPVEQWLGSLNTGRSQSRSLLSRAGAALSRAEAAEVARAHEPRRAVSAVVYEPHCALPTLPARTAVVQETLLAFCQ